MRRSLWLCLSGMSLAVPMAASAQVTHGEEVIAPPSDELTVRGGPFPRCFKRPGDPLDSLRMRGSEEMQQMLDPATMRLIPDPNPITGPDVWQRAGRGLTSYVFRAPLDGTPLCIGNRGGGGRYGQLRQILDAKPFVGKYVRFTAFMATPPNTDVRVWFAAANHLEILVGDIHGGKNVTGTGRWEPVSVTIGKIPIHANLLSYGFLLAGEGDVWATQIKIEVFDKKPPEVGRRTI